MAGFATNPRHRTVALATAESSLCPPLELLAGVWPVFDGVCCAGAADLAGALGFGGGDDDGFLFDWAKTAAGKTSARESSASVRRIRREMGEFIVIGLVVTATLASVIDSSS